MKKEHQELILKSIDNMIETNKIMIQGLNGNLVILAQIKNLIKN